MRQYRKGHPPDPAKERARSAAWRAANTEKALAVQAAWRSRNRDSERERGRRYASENPEKERRRKARRWADPETRVRMLEYTREKRRTDRNFRLAGILRCRIRSVLRGRVRQWSALQLLGCTLDEACAHLESKFLPGMTWENQGRNGWHVDHIVPLSILDLSDPCEMARGCHYTNLQPLWASDNYRKGNRAAA